MKRFLLNYWVCSLVILYLVAFLFLAGGLALQSWPDNPLRQRLYVNEVERLASLQVTDEGIEALNQALTIAARLPAPDETPRPSRADLNTLIAQLAFAETIIGRSVERDSDPFRWDRKTVSIVSSQLSTARKKLEDRNPALLPSRMEAKPFIILQRTFFPSAPADIQPRLTNSEQARVAALLADMNNPRVAEPSTEIGRKVRPLLDKIQDTDFILLVLALGAWGASAQSLASIARYLGVRRYNNNWVVFYLTRPFIGATLSFAFYIVLRGGLMAREASWTDINHVGYAAVAVLVGFFSTEALENLKRIASGFFAEKDSTDGLNGINPILREARWFSEGALDYLELVGENFSVDARVLIDGVPLKQGVHYISAQIIRAELTAAQLAPRSTVKVANPTPHGIPSDGIAVPPFPTSPWIEKAVLSSTPPLLTLSGRRFAPQVAVLVNGVLGVQPLTVGSPSTIILDLATSPIADGATLRVTNLAGPGGTSNEVVATPPAAD